MIAPELSASSQTAATATVFEQPLNERMRTFLRLDFLYNQALYHNEKASSWGSRAAMNSLMDILAIMARGDIRADVLKELERHLAQLNDLSESSGHRQCAAAGADGQPHAPSLGSGGRRHWLAAAVARLGVSGRDQAAQRHSGRHLRI